MYVGVWVCSWATGVVIGMDWMYLVRVTGSVVGLAGGVFGGVLQRFFKETCLTTYVRIYVYVMFCFTCNFVKCVCSRKANFHVIIDNKDSVLSDRLLDLS